MNVCFLSIIMWTNVVVFFYKYNSSLGMAILFPQLHSSLDLATSFTFHSWSLTFYSSKKLDCYSWHPVQHEIFIYAFPRPWVGLIALKVLPRPSFGGICLVFPCFTLREACRRYISASRKFTRLGLLAFLWINLNKNNMNTKNSHNTMYIV